jgi:hypothetical protein
MLYSKAEKTRTIVTVGTGAAECDKDADCNGRANVSV